MDAVLLENTGLTLAETAGIGLEHFQHLPEYDAYYHTHGDTNYFHSVQIAAGERTGDTLRLYYPDHFARYEACDWLCVTLAAQSDGSYWFVSNQPSEEPAIPTVYPEGEPALTIPLTDPAPYTPAFSAKRLDSLPDDISAAWDAYGTTCRLCRLEDGNLHVVLVYTPPSGGTGIYWDVFAFPDGLSEDQITLSDAYGLLGHDCVVVSYWGYVDLPDSRLSDWINDYYSFDGDGNPILLARAYGETAQTDLDGDGEDELCASSGWTACRMTSPPTGTPTAPPAVSAAWRMESSMWCWSTRRPPGAPGSIGMYLPSRTVYRRTKSPCRTPTGFWVMTA